MSTHIDILFAGLIAFVSESAFEPSSTTAYVVYASDHRAVVQFTGKVKLESASDSPINCTSTSKPEDEFSVISCDLDDTEIIFSPSINKGEIFPAGPPRRGIPVVGEDRSLRWILRMSNIQVGTGKIKDNVDKWVVGKFTFGWYLAESCELDSQEPESGRRGRPALIGFRSGNARSPHRQAVAECLMFGARVPEEKITIKLQKGRAVRVIIADCRDSSCLTVNISNHLRYRTSCDDDIVEGIHYKHYYDMVENPGHRLIPFSISEKCRNLPSEIIPPGIMESVGQLAVLSPPVVESGLRVIRPLSVDFEEAVRRRIGRGWVSLKRIRETLVRTLREPSFKNLAGFEREIIDIFEVRAEVMDRVICPPTVLER